MTGMEAENALQEYKEMLNQDKYITFKEYNRFLEKYKHIFQKEYSKSQIVQEIANNGYKKRIEHNQFFINKKLLTEKDYFDNMFKNIDSKINLDEEQRKAIINEEDYSLIIAGAGSGKTTTMAAKVKYLIEKKYINPSKIAVVSYTNKAIDELEDRIKYEFNLPVDIMTFHSLGMRIIRKIFKNPIEPLAEREQKEIIVNFVKEILFPNKDLLTQYIEAFNKYKTNNTIFAKGFVENYKKFPTFNAYFEDYKIRKQKQNKENLQEIIEYRTNAYLKLAIPRSLKNEQMRSKAEAKIANFLFTHGIDYKYEEPYPEKIEEDKAYLPDFTIEVNGIPLYIEYFGLSGYYENGAISEKNRKKYESIREKKRKFHKINNNNYIELDYKREAYGSTIDYLEDLKNKLNAHNVPMRTLSNYEIFEQILNNNTMAEFYGFIEFILDIIEKIKSHPKREQYKEIIKNHLSTIDDIASKSEHIKEANLLIEIYNYYNNELLPKNKIDFADMIYYANKYITSISEANSILDYEHLIIDEYQDISIDRYQFAKNISLLSNAKVTSVGDDWQTIFSFAGSRIDLFLRYNLLFPGAEALFINKTYRNSQELIDKAGIFVMKNPIQIKKNLVSDTKRKNPIQICKYDNEKIWDQFELVRDILNRIYNNNPNDHVLILARKNRHIINLLKMDYFMEGIDTRIRFKDHPDMIIDAMSVHNAKGLGADQVILLNVTKDDFPCKTKDEMWLKEIFKPIQYTEPFNDAEDRRIFYVALTRTKKDSYILIPKNEKHVSPYIKELLTAE